MKKADGKIWIVEAKGGSATVTICNVDQSNGLIHVVDSVLLPVPELHARPDPFQQGARRQPGQPGSLFCDRDARQA